MKGGMITSINELDLNDITFEKMHWGGGLGRERGAGCTALASGQPGLDDCRYPLVRRVEL